VEAFDLKTMSKNRKRQSSGKIKPLDQSATNRKWLGPAAIILMLAAAGSIFYYGRARKNTAPGNIGGSNPSSPVIARPPASLQPEQVRMNIAEAVVVTVELDFGGRVPTIAEAIQQIERSYAPDDRVGRTFSILDAFGGPTADGKLLHMSMHVSSEKPGMGYLRFKRTGELLWQARIGSPGDAPAGQKNLMIYLSNGSGGNYVLDGGRGGTNLLDVFLQNSNQRVRDVWPDGAEREMTFIYSACGCPVKLMARRAGERVPRTLDTPVIFPDDPMIVTTISNLMKW
jgi:hypothetical protein